MKYLKYPYWIKKHWTFYFDRDGKPFVSLSKEHILYEGIFFWLDIDDYYWTEKVPDKYFWLVKAYWKLEQPIANWARKKADEKYRHIVTLDLTEEQAEILSNYYMRADNISSIIP